MKLDVQIDAKYLEARTLKEQKRLAFNTATALNNAAKSIQADVQAEMAKDFHLRNASKSGKQWLLQRIKINFASVKNGVMFAEVYVDQKDRLLLGLFEDGGERDPFVGKNVAIPNPAQARQGGSFAGSVRDDLTFKALGLHRVPNKAGNEVLNAGFSSGLNNKQFKRLRQTLTADQFNVKGANRTFLIRSTAKNPLGGIYQRIGPGKDDIRLVYSFHRAFQLKRLLNLVETAKKNFPEKFRVELSIAYARNPVE